MQEKRYPERGGASSMKRYMKAIIPVFILVLSLCLIPVHAAVISPLLAGSAERADDGSIRLTNKKAGQAGGVWFSEPLRTVSGFTRKSSASVLYTMTIISLKRVQRPSSAWPDFPCSPPLPYMISEVQTAH